MDVDRGVLARIDRKLLTSLGQDATFRMVRVPATAAMWSTWRRYCDAVGVSTGRAIAVLIGHELVGVLGGADAEDAPLLADQADEEVARLEKEVAHREQELEAAEDRLRAWDLHLRSRESDLEGRERQVNVTAEPSNRPEQSGVKVGRNEPCPCGSGRKYKHCHGGRD